MIPEIYESLISLLTARTEDGYLSWSIAAYSNSLTTTLDGTDFEIWDGFDDNIERSYIGFAIKQGNETLDSFYCNMYDRGYPDLERLKGSAQRSAHNLNPRIHDLINRLKKK